jgi:drug/metabolite transporter (DMT)-like permease
MHLDNPQLVPVALSLVAVCCWGSSDFVGGVASRRVNAFLFTAIAHACAVAVMGSAAGWGHAPFPSRHAVVWAMVAGAVGGISLAVFYRALSLGQMGLTTPVAAVLGAAIPAIFVIGTEGSPGVVPLMGFFCAACGVWLISREEDGHGRPAGLWLAVLAGMGFAGFYLSIHQAGNESAAWLATISRLTSLIVTAAAVLLSGALRRVDKSTLALALLAGTLDVTGTVVFIRASQMGRLDVAVVLSSLYPAITVLLARIILKEHFTRWKTVGMLTALAAVPLIALQ